MADRKLIQKEGSNRRDAFRIDDVLSMALVPLTPESFAEKKQHIDMNLRQVNLLSEVLGQDLGVSGQGGEPLGFEISKALQVLNHKLNYLIGIEMFNKAAALHLEDRPANISVGGMSFTSEHKFTEGDYLQIILMLPSSPPLIVEPLAEVKWCRRSKQGVYKIGVAFVYRCQEEERIIARYIFKRQREMIRLQALQDLSNR